MSEPLKAIGRIEWQAILLLALVFGAGAAVGVAGDHLLRPPPPPVDHGGPPFGRPDGPPRGPDSLRLPRYFEELNPTDAQRVAIRGLLEVQRPKADSIMGTVLPKLRAISDATFAAVRALLTPEQQKRYDATRPQRAFLPMPGMRGGPPGGPPGRGARRGPPPDFPPDGPPPERPPVAPAP